METLGYAFSLTYSARKHFPFSTYGENFFLTLQNVVVTLLILLYQPRASHSSKASTARELNTSGAVTGGVVALATAGLLAMTPNSTLPLLQLLTLPLSLFSKVPQIMSNARAGSTGQLSAVAVISQIAGCLARVFTTAQEVNDPLVMWGFLLALGLNLVVGAQMWMYWGKDDVGGSMEREKERPSEWLREKTEFPAVPAALSNGNGNGAGMAATPPRPTAPMMYSTPSASGRKWARKVD